ncbi:MAG: OsmC family protein [Pseudomonadota bacterium]
MQQHIRDSLLRAREAFERRPSAALQNDSPALAVWQGGVSTLMQHPALPGAVHSDLPAALGGEGHGPSPGWYFRAGIASCMATSIAMEAALLGIRLSRLEVVANSESDARGMLGNASIASGPLRMWLTISLDAADTPEAQLRDLVTSASAKSPMADGLRRELEVSLDLHVRASPAQ